MGMDNILVYYVDEVAPTFTMKKLTAGVIAVIVVVSLIVIAGLIVLVSEPVYSLFLFLSKCSCLTLPLYSVVPPQSTRQGQVQQSTGELISLH